MCILKAQNNWLIDVRGMLQDLGMDICDTCPPCRLDFSDHVLILYFNPDGPTITLLGTELEISVSFMLRSYALCQERYASDDTRTMG